MSFAEERTRLAVSLTDLHNHIRRAFEESKALEEYAATLIDKTETFADDTALAKVAGTAKRTRQDLSALSRAVTETREGLGS